MRHVPRRTYDTSPDAVRRPGRGDVAEAAYRLRALVYGGSGGVVLGVAGLAHWGGAGFLVGFLLGTALTYGVTMLVVRGGAAAAGTVYHPSGRSTPYQPVYSDAQALAARGLYQEAIDCYETYAAEFPDDPEPGIAIARLQRDALGQHEQAIGWFRRARQAAGCHRGQEAQVTREIIEIYLHKLNQPRRAIPELARLADRFARTREGDEAASELARLKEELVSE